MPFKVIKPLGDHKVGDIVDDEYGATVLAMYDEPHVESVSESKRTPPIESPAEEELEAKPRSGKGRR